MHCGFSKKNVKTISNVLISCMVNWSRSAFLWYFLRETWKIMRVSFWERVKYQKLNGLYMCVWRDWGVGWRWQSREISACSSFPKQYELELFCYFMDFSIEHREWKTLCLMILQNHISKLKGVRPRRTGGNNTNTNPAKEIKCKTKSHGAIYILFCICF